MNEFETIPENNPASKRGLIIAIAALVLAIAVGFGAYNLLTSQNAPQSAAADTSASESPSASADSASTSAATDRGSASATSQSDSTSAETSTNQAPLLSDFNATIYTLDEQAFTLTEIADGKPLVMNFWATWCPYCIKEMDDYQAIYNDYKDRVSFAFIDSVDGVRETPEKAAQWLADNGYDLPSYYDLTTEAQYMYGATSLPTTVIVAANGEVKVVSPGQIDPTRMRSALDALI